jgi:hypothetical protein
MKKHFLAMTAFLFILGFSASASAATITIDDINGWTPVRFSIGSASYYVYAGEFQLTIDGVESAGYCVDLFHETYIGTLYDVSFTHNYISNGAQAGWLMVKYRQITVENAALQLAICAWNTNRQTPFTYLGPHRVGTVGISQHLSLRLGDNFYCGYDYQSHARTRARTSW